MNLMISSAHRPAHPNHSNARSGEGRSGLSYSRDAERTLMRSIHEACGALIREATGDDAAASALIAAIAANESSGQRQAYQFSPGNYNILSELLHGDADKIDGLTGPRLEKRLSAAKSESERLALMKRLAGLHGYTHIPGYYSILWRFPLEALCEKETHFKLAARRLKKICREFRLDPSVDAIEIARRWNGDCMSGAPRSPLYSWRLAERMRLYGETVQSAPPYQLVIEPSGRK
jgi:hypothetical protein